MNSLTSVGSGKIERTTGKSGDRRAKVGLGLSGCACPLCGSAEAASGMQFADQFVAMNDDYVQLTRGESIVFGAMFRGRPRMVLKERIYSVYVADRPLDIDWPDLKIIDVYILKLRRKLARLGISIVTVTGTGYRLIEPPARSIGLEAAE
jgi:hypothetical protein